MCNAADLKNIDVPVLSMHGDDDQIVPIADSALLGAKLVRKGTLKVHKRLSHGMCVTHPDLINNNLLAFIQADPPAVSPGGSIEYPEGSCAGCNRPSFCCTRRRATPLASLSLHVGGLFAPLALAAVRFQEPTHLKSVCQ